MEFVYALETDVPNLLKKVEYEINRLGPFAHIVDVHFYTAAKKVYGERAIIKYRKVAK